MPYPSSKTAKLLWFDWDTREEILRRVITERLAESTPKVPKDHLLATYFFALRSWTLEEASKEIAYHATSGIKKQPKGSLLEKCTARMVGTDPFDRTGRMGLLHMAFPLKMLRQVDGHITSTDVFHTIAGAIIFDVYENQDARLVRVELPPEVIRTFPGPAHGPAGFRSLTKLGSNEVAFGTILKPTAGITDSDVERLVTDVAQCSLFSFVKEDENLYPNLDYAPIRARARKAAQAVRRIREKTGRPLIFAPHITGAPHEIVQTIDTVLEAGVQGVMFSESFATGAVRLVRERTRRLATPPLIYGHNAGIGVRTRAIWREVIDLFARLDGIDFRQTAPVRPGQPFLKPYGDEWVASEEILTRPLPGINPTTLVRAGSLDQGNIGLNLADVENRGVLDKVLFLAGSAINSIYDRNGKANVELGAEAMLQAIDIHRSGALSGVAPKNHLKALYAFAQKKRLKSLAEALRQRYSLPAR